MGSFIKDENFLNDNIFLFEKRLGSQYSIFFDGKTPTFVTYYHINNINSIADSGFLNVENILGPESPIRFQKIESFPLYGIESIKPDLVDEDEGLNSNFDGEAIALPNTIKPLPNDFFTINYLDNTFLFMVTEVAYDTIKSNNFYSLNYTMRSGTEKSLLDCQVLEKYNCIYQNIGTDDKCLIRSDEYEKLHELKKWYNKISDQYMTLFYKAKYNSFLYETGEITFLYDKFLTNFINVNKIFSKPNSYDTLQLSNEDYSRTFILEYEDSIYRRIEELDKAGVEHMKAFHWDIAYPDSIFKYYNVEYMRSIRLNPTGDKEYLPDRLIDDIKTNNITDNTPILDRILISYFNNRYNTIYDVDIELLNRFRIRNDFNTFIMLPIALYCIGKVVDKFMKTIDTVTE